MNLDLADLESVRAFATQFKTKYSRLDVLVNNGKYTLQGHVVFCRQADYLASPALTSWTDGGTVI